jgi:hypothetical protein
MYHIIYNKFTVDNLYSINIAVDGLPFNLTFIHTTCNQHFQSAVQLWPAYCRNDHVHNKYRVCLCNPHCYMFRHFKVIWPDHTVITNGTVHTATHTLIATDCNIKKIL